MGKTRPHRVNDTKRARKAARQAELSNAKSSVSEDAGELLAKAAANLQIGLPDGALPLAQQAEALLKSQQPATSVLPALVLLGEIYVDLGQPDDAVAVFQRAAQLDPDGLVPEAEGGGAEKYFWLAQLSENGGQESIEQYQHGVKILEQIISRDEGKPALEQEQEERRKKLASALCSMIEVWMTDLSFEDKAEAECEALISRAMLVSSTPYVPTLQTLASIRLSQARVEDAQAALKRSLELWTDLPPEHPDVPDFATRISLTRLSMEAEMEDTALEVVERLVGEDDQSVEAWYLGGWCQYLMSKSAEGSGGEGEGEEKSLRLSSREWLRNCLKLYELLEYEDERLHDHAKELIGELDAELGEEEIEDEDEGEWEDEESDSMDDDHAMDTS